MIVSDPRHAFGMRADDAALNAITRGLAPFYEPLPSPDLPERLADLLRRLQNDDGDHAAAPGD